MSESSPQADSDQTDDDRATSGGPTDEQLPGNRTDGPDEHPLKAEEAEGGEVGAG